METLVMDRQAKGLRIARAKRIKALGSVWVVPSESHSGSYVVDAQTRTTSCTCTCPDFELNRTPCKHVFAVQFVRHRITDDGSSVTETLRVTYTQNWSAYNAAQVNEKDLVQRLLKGLCSGITMPEQQRGRPRLPLADVIFSCVSKVYEGTSGRRASTDIRDAEARGHIDHAPHYNSISAYLAQPELTPILTTMIEDSAIPLKAVETNFAVDATGFGTSVYHRWYDHKYGRNRKSATWLKAHAMIGVKTNIVTSIEVTRGETNDAPQFVGLLGASAKTFNIKEVSADKAYLARAHLDAVEAVGGQMYVPFKLNSKQGTHEAWQRLWHLYHFRKPAFLAHYHQRSNVEATFSAMKRLFGGSLRSKKYEAQVNEVLCKVLAYNLTCVVHSMFELGVEPEFLSA